MDVERFSKEVGRFKLGKDFSVFLICLLIATLFWLLNAFTKTYSTVIEIPIEYSNLPQDRILANELPKETTAEVTGTGFRLLSVSFFNQPDALTIDYNSGKKQALKSGESSIYSPDYIRAQVMAEIPSELTLGAISIDSLKMTVEDQTSKLVWVKSNHSYQVEYPFFFKSAVEVSPKQIEIIGGFSVLKSIDTVYTEEHNFGELKHPTTKDLGIQLPAGVSSKTSKITVHLPVDEFTEITKKVDLKITNLDSKNELILFPQQVEVTGLVGLSDFDKVSEQDFTFEVDASEIEKDRTTLIVKLVDQPKEFQLQEYKPHKVEFILKK